MGSMKDHTESINNIEKYGKWENYWKVPGVGEKVSWEQTGQLLRGRESKQVEAAGPVARPQLTGT